MQKKWEFYIKGKLKILFFTFIVELEEIEINIFQTNNFNFPYSEGKIIYLTKVTYNDAKNSKQ
jgi:hypothetical protein